MIGTKNVLAAAAGMLGLAVVAGVTLPEMSAAIIKAALTEIVVPSKPFFTELTLIGNTAVADGPGTGTLGVSSLTFTNYDNAPQQVFVLAPVLSGGNSCTTGSVVGGGGPQLTVIVPAKQTLHVPYPTPLVFGATTGQTCIAAEVTTGHTGAVTVDINGFVD